MVQLKVIEFQEKPCQHVVTMYLQVERGTISVNLQVGLGLAMHHVGVAIKYWFHPCSSCLTHAGMGLAMVTNKQEY